MKVIVGSLNPVKIDAVREVFEDVFGTVEVEGVRVSSDVPEQPVGYETARGAENRAKRIMKEHDCEYAVGIEGGLAYFGGTPFFMGYVVILDRGGRKGVSTQGWFEAPPKFLRGVEQGRQLGDVADEIHGETNVKQKQGTIGVLTNNKVPRKDIIKHSVYLALSRFLHPEFWEE